MKKLTLLLTLIISSVTVHASERIISAGSSITELIYALNAQDQLVAADSTSRALVEKDEIPVVGYHRQLSSEGLLALQPTVLIGSEEMGPETTVSVLKNSGINVVVATSGDDIADLYTRVDAVAKVTQKEAEAKKIKAQIRNDLESLENQKLDTSPNVMFLLTMSGRPLSVAGSETSVDKVIHLAGGQNPASSQFTSYKAISLESILKMQPDYLLVAQRSWDSIGGIKGILDKYPLLKATPAGHNKRIVPIPGTALIGGFGLESIKLSGELNEMFLKDFSTN